MSKMIKDMSVLAIMNIDLDFLDSLAFDSDGPMQRTGMLQQAISSEFLELNFNLYAAMKFNAKQIKIGKRA